MKVLKRIIFGLIALALLLAVAGYVYLQTTKPVYSGELSLKGLTDEVEVLYDQYGVPHIYAKNAADAYFALGFVHAQDRLFQMEMLRRAASGRLSEVLGKELLPVDKLFRTIGINVFAREHAQKFLGTDTADFQKAVLAYQRGINQFIQTGKTPLEFSIIGIPKTEFTAEDIYLAQGFMAFGFAEGIQADPVLEGIKDNWGLEYLKDVAVQTPADAVRLKSFHGPVKKLSSNVVARGASLRETIRMIPTPLWSGSNGWVIAGDLTSSGAPILANDTHVGFGQPAVWYEAHMEYPGFSLYGHYIAGVPFATLGNNRFCGWGLTMFENDDTDYFKETLNPENKNQVKFKDQWEDLSQREEIIKVKGEEDVVITVKSSRHGPIINDIMEDLIPVDSTTSLWWMPTHLVSGTVQAMFKLNHAGTFEEAQSSVQMLAAPGLNVMYGDAAGNIAWWAAAKLPIRPAHVNSKFFLDGASGKDEYLGFYDFSKNPQSINPPSGFVYSANNQPDTVDGVLYPGYYYPRSRAGRIAELLSVKKKWTINDIKQTNLDVVSHMHADIAKLITTIILDLRDPNLNYLTDELADWDGDHQINQTAPSVYYNLLSNIIQMAIKDELGKEAYEALMGSSIPKNSYDILLRNENSPWWDDIRTKDKKETRADIVGAAARRTIELLRTTSGNNSADWRWGKIHTLTHEHPLGSVKPLDKLFNVGPFVVPGGSEVINNLHFDLDTTGYFPVTGGPALRKITDFSDVNVGETVSPTGQSGNVMSAHYDDQAEMFATGKFRRMLMNRPDIETISRERLLLRPAK